jgi:hypothetical protein
MKRYAHHYNGKTAGRGSRQLSKLYKGIKKGDLTPVYQLIDYELQQTKRETIRGLCEQKV